MPYTASHTWLTILYIIVLSEAYSSDFIMRVELVYFMTGGEGKTMIAGKSEKQTWREKWAVVTILMQEFSLEVQEVQCFRKGEGRGGGLRKPALEQSLV